MKTQISLAMIALTDKDPAVRTAAMRRLHEQASRTWVTEQLQRVRAVQTHLATP